MAERLTTQKFITRAIENHGDRYGYGKSIYTSSGVKVIITCTVHGDFSQEAHHHLSGSDCPRCAITERGEKKKKVAKLTFEEKSNKLHNNRYDYSKVLYIDSQTKVEIICSVHGSFIQTPSCHLAGHGCWKCYLDSKYRKRENFIEQSNRVHNNFYSYEKFVYNYAKEKSIITCPLHGDFLQTPDAHSRGTGCPLCGAIKLAKISGDNPTGWSASNWQKGAEISKTFESYKVYILKLSNIEETFYKIGRTYREISARIKDFRLSGYGCEILHVMSSEDSRAIYDLETQLRRRYKHLKYLPKIDFGGKHECFSELPISDIIANYPTNYIPPIDDAPTATP